MYVKTAQIFDKEPFLYPDEIALRKKEMSRDFYEEEQAIICF